MKENIKYLQLHLKTGFNSLFLSVTQYNLSCTNLFSKNSCHAVQFFFVSLFFKLSVVNEWNTIDGIIFVQYVTSGYVPVSRYIIERTPFTFRYLFVLLRIVGYINIWGLFKPIMFQPSSCPWRNRGSSQPPFPLCIPAHPAS